MVFVIELAEWYETQKDMMFGIISACYEKKARGEFFRSKSFFASTTDGVNIKILVKFTDGNLSGIETHRHPRVLPNWLFPFMLTENGKKKNIFFREKFEMLAALKDGVEYTLTTTSESLTNNQGSIAFFQLKKDGNVLIVDGIKHNL